MTCKFALLPCLALSLLAALADRGTAAPFVAFDREAGSAEIVLFHDADADEGFDWEALANPRLSPAAPKYRLREAVRFLQDGLRRMTGVAPKIRSDSDLRQGLVLVLLDQAPEAIRSDAAIRAALANSGEDAYNHREAFYLRSEPDRLLIVANTIDGLAAAMPALLGSVGYEVLGMGPHWTHAPDHRQRLTFDLEMSDRPSFYLRQLVPTTGQYRGVGTLQTGRNLELTDPHDESVGESYLRWAIGWRNFGFSMDRFPGHALYAYHRPVVDEIRRTGSTVGFLTPATHLGLDSERPEATEENKSQLWLNSDPPETPGHGKAFVSNGKEWQEQKLNGMHVNVDTSTPVVRQIVFERMKERAAAHFAEHPNDPFVFGVEAEDGAGYANAEEWIRPEFRNWYPDYLAAEGVAWPQPYRLHGYRGIDQPQEKFEHGKASDLVFAFNNWLLREFDQWIESLPQAEQVTSSGQSKKSLVRTSIYSYAYHDVPPQFNLDPRIRVMIAGYPKHRGLGEWKDFRTKQQVAAAFKQLLPREPSAEYRIISISYYADHTLDGIPARWSSAPVEILNDLQPTYAAGIRALTCEMDFNFGKYGLAYYLLSKTLWKTDRTPEELMDLRRHWLQLSYGSAWQVMERYYDFLLPENLPINAPGAWGEAIQMIEEADALLDPALEPEPQSRLDDLKQYWYFYYLLDTGAVESKSPALVEFLWKGQMSYMTAMHAVLHRTYGWSSSRVVDHLPAELKAGPAHYTPAETAHWWKRVREHWPVIEVDMFADVELADGRSGRSVDLNDLVAVKEFQSLPAGAPFHYNSAQAPPTVVVMSAKAGQSIGFRVGWPAGEVLRFYGPKEVAYGVEWWDREQKRWTAIVDPTTTKIASHEVTSTKNDRVRHVAEVAFPAPHDGAYRFEIGPSGFLAGLASLGYDFVPENYSSQPTFSFAQRPRGLTQGPAWFYIPKGVKRLDLEVWDAYDRKTLTLYSGRGEKGLTRSREVDISSRGAHRVELKNEETGQLAQIRGNGFAFPLLYSVPQYWAKSPAELVVPRAIAAADGLEIAE